MKYQPESNRRKWLIRHGKGKYIDFSDKQLRKLRNYFNSLDDNQSGSIGVDELEEPLIGLGLVETRQQVKEIVEMVDEDSSEMIEFEEFLSIIKGGSAASKENSKTKKSKDNSQAAAIFDFFQQLTDGKDWFDPLTMLQEKWLTKTTNTCRFRFT